MQYTWAKAGDMETKQMTIMHAYIYTTDLPTHVCNGEEGSMHSDVTFHNWIKMCPIGIQLWDSSHLFPVDLYYDIQTSPVMTAPLVIYSTCTWLEL